MTSKASTNTNTSTSTSLSSGSRAKSSLQLLVAAELNRQSQLQQSSERQQAALVNKPAPPTQTSSPGIGHKDRKAGNREKKNKKGNDEDKHGQELHSCSSTSLLSSPCRVEQKPGSSRTANGTERQNTSDLTAGHGEEKARAVHEHPSPVSKPTKPNPTLKSEFQPESRPASRLLTVPSSPKDSTTVAAVTTPSVCPPPLPTAPNQPPHPSDLNAGLYYHQNRLVALAAARRTMGLAAWRSDERDLAGWETWHVECLGRLEARVMEDMKMKMEMEMEMEMEEEQL